MVDVAEVKIWGDLVGAVRWDQEQQLGYFEYDAKFLQMGRDLSPLKMPIENGRRIYSFPELRMGIDELLRIVAEAKKNNQILTIHSTITVSIVDK